MSEYKELPNDVVKLVIRRWGCGDICCCSYFWIQGVTDIDQKYSWNDKTSKKAYDLWEGTWWNSDCICDRVIDKDKSYYDSKEEILDELIEACKHYGIPTDKLTVENFWEIDEVEYVVA